MQRIKTVAIDFDDTIAETQLEIIKLSKVNLKKEQLLEYKTLPDAVGGYHKFHDYLLQAHQSNNLAPIPKSLECIFILQKHFDCFILTSNKDNHIPYIKKWLEEFGIDIEIYNSNGFANKFNYDFDLIIDDHPELYPHCDKHTRGGILIQQPYNKGQFGWQTVYNLMNKYELNNLSNLLR